MPHSVVTQMLASRPSPAALASLFSDASDDMPPRLSRRRVPVVSILGGHVVARAKDLFLSQVLVDDVIFPTVEPRAQRVAA